MSVPAGSAPLMMTFAAVTVDRLEAGVRERRRRRSTSVPEWASVGFETTSALAVDDERVEAAGAAVGRAGDRAAGLEHEGVLVVGRADEVLEADERDAADRAGAGAP